MAQSTLWSLVIYAGFVLISPFTYFSEVLPGRHAVCHL